MRLNNYILLKSFSIGYLMLLGFMANAQRHAFEFYTETFNFKTEANLLIAVDQTASAEAATSFYQEISKSNYQSLISTLQNFRDANHLNDWIYYQLIRKTAEEISPKEKNYFRYTLYKWFLLGKCGYDARIAIGNKQVVFYVRNDEDISDIPFFMIDNQKYMCLNYHDYGKLFKQSVYIPFKIRIPEAVSSFSYKVTKIPDFKPEDYEEKDVQFSYKQRVYHFKLKVNQEIQTIFKNYPLVDYESYFNIPLSRETYSSLIPILKENVKKMDQKKGVDYLMRFTRYAFLYEDDGQNFGKEKRLSPEQTLLNKYSDCDDRAALFFFLVKEIYNLPMIALLYPTHLTMAVQFDKPVGNFITYQGKKYSFCEPTPQIQDLKIGQISNNLKNASYEIVYAYEPLRK